MKKFLALLAILLMPTVASAQAWTGIIDPVRAMNWSIVGVQGGIPTTRTRCGSVIAAYTGTAATINTAIDNCGANQYVELGAGTFTLSTGIELDKDNVTLKGQGANSTFLALNGNTNVSCHIGDGRAFNMCKNGANIGVDSPDNTATWSSGYAQGSTTVVLSGHANMVVGSTLWLDQVDDASNAEAYPAPGDIWLDNWQGGDSYARASRGLVEGHLVTGCGVTTPGAACTGNTITITPPIMMPNYRSARSPGAWWGNTSSVLSGVGVENLAMTVSGRNALYMINCTNCYLKGIKIVYPGTISSGQYRVTNFINVVHSTVESSYFYGPQASGLVSIYGIATHIVSVSLFQNNIIQLSVNPFVINSPTYGSVFAYNYFNAVGINPSFSQPSFILHGHASMNLFEGNNGRNFSGDNIHSAHHLTTLFRNYWTGTSQNPSGTEAQAAITLYAVQRFFNVIGNVMGDTIWTTYSNGQSPPAHCTSCIYELGWQGTNSVGSMVTGNDTNVSRTIMRWGNWDGVNAATRFVSGEVPSGISYGSNPVPGSEVLPSSFYLSARPSWYAASIPYPSTGPDVSGGNIASPSNGGHANKIPARVCYENSTFTGGVMNFDAATCYVSTSVAPNPPINLTSIMN